MASTNALIAQDETTANPDTGLPGAATGTGTGAGAAQGANPLIPQTNDLTMLNPAMAITGGLPTGSQNPLTPQTGAFTDYVAPVQGGGPSGITQKQMPIAPPPPPAPVAPVAPPAAAAPPPAAGAQQAQDGQWYVPNPNGKGWMMMSAYDQLPGPQQVQMTEGPNDTPTAVRPSPFDAPAGSYVNPANPNQLMVPDGQGGFYPMMTPTISPLLAQQQGHH